MTTDISIEKDRSDATERRAGGEFVRGVSGFRHAIGDADFPPEPGRYHLFVALNCPWCHRVTMARNVLGLSDSIMMDVASPNRTDEDDPEGPKLCTSMRAEDVTNTIELALTASSCDQAVVRHKPRLLSELPIEGAIGSCPMGDGSCYISGDLAKWREGQKMTHIRGAPFHPQTQGKIGRCHQTIKNRVLPENYDLPDDLERQIGAFVDYYNNQRYHEGLNNVTPADVYFGRDKAILREREKIKKLTIPLSGSCCT